MSDRIGYAVAIVFGLTAAFFGGVAYEQASNDEPSSYRCSTFESRGIETTTCEDLP